MRTIWSPEPETARSKVKVNSIEILHFSKLGNSISVMCKVGPLYIRLRVFIPCLCFDVLVSVWSVDTGQCYDKMKFRHQKPVLCVKTNQSLVLSGCEGGLIKMWDIKTATLLKVS